MSRLMVGGLGFNRFKNLNVALEEARQGDCVTLSRSVTLSEHSELSQDITIDGCGKKLTLIPDQVSFVVKGSPSLTFKNLTIRMPEHANALLLDEGFEGTVTFDHVVFERSPRVDARDIYSPVISKSQSAEFVVKDSTIPFIELFCKKLHVERSVLGDVYGAKSTILTQLCSVVESEASNVTLKSMYSNQACYVQLVNTRSHGQLTICEADGKMVNLNFQPLLNQKGEAFDHEREYKRQFTNPIYELEENTLLTFERCGQTSGSEFEVEGLVMDRPYDVNDFLQARAMSVEDSFLSLKNSRLVGQGLPSKLVSSTLKLEHVKDENKWDTRDVQLSQVNSRSPLIDESDHGQEPTALEQIHAMIGLETVKKQIDQMIATAKMNALRKQRGLTENTGYSQHMVFGGHAGTGKTSIAKLFGKALYENGILPTNRFVFATEPDLVAGYLGQTAQKTKDKVMEAKGGVLFIDEAYSLTPSNDNQTSFKQEAIDQLVALADELRDDTVIILAGYTQPMKRFLESNEGLKSRFKNWIEFPDYSLDELFEILSFQLNQQDIKMSEADQVKLSESFYRYWVRMTDNGQKAFNGNGRTVRNYVQDLIQAKDVRLNQANLFDLNDEDLVTVTGEDIDVVDRKLLTNAS